MNEDENKLILDSFTSFYQNLNFDNEYSSLYLELFLEELLKTNFNEKKEDNQCQN